MKKIFLYTCIVAVVVSSCDKVKQPYIKGSTGTVDTSEKKVRKILLEEFTGHTCTNCPPAAVTIHTLQDQHPGRIIAIAIHSGGFAFPSAPTYTANFQSTTGDNYATTFNIDHNPVGLINRKGYPNSIMKEVGQWSGIIEDSLLPLPPDADLKITNTYNSSTRILNGSVTCKFLTSMNGTYKIVLLITEDSIVNAQKFPGNIDSLNYVHRHVLRGAISSTDFGDVLKTGLIAAGDSGIKTFNYTLPPSFNNTIPDESHCYVVAYIYDAVTYEIIQAEEKKIK